MSLSGTQRILVRSYLNGQLVEGLLRASVVSTNCFAADTYSLTYSLGAHAAGDVDYWHSTSSGYIELTVEGLRQNTPTLMISGMIDAIHIDPIQRLVSLEGRDLSSLMVDSYRQEDFVNQSASEIVTSIALGHNLLPVVAATAGTVGRYYGDGYTKLSLGQFSSSQSEWDLVVQLARDNDFDAYVKNRTLFFQPSGSSNTVPLVVSLNDVLELRVERNLALLGNVSAKVQSWSSQNMAAYQSLETPQEASVEVSNGDDVSSFLFSASNSTPLQVSNAAARYAAELSRLGTVLSFEMPSNFAMVPRSAFLLQGTISSLDTTYVIDTVEWMYSPLTGSIQTVRAVPLSA